MSTDDSSNREKVCQEENDAQNLPNMEDFITEGFKILRDSLRYANNLPARRDFDFYYTQQSFKKIINSEGNHILSLMNNIMKKNGIHDNVKTSILEHKMELLVEANDIILERVANNIDEMNGIKKNTIAPVELQTVTENLVINGSWNNPTRAKYFKNSSEKQTGNSQESIKLLTAKNISKPQLLFTDKIDNSSLYPWEPKIKDKPNSLKPLAILLEETERGEEFSHPYELELDNFKPPQEQLKPDEREPEFPQSIEKTKLIEVTTPELLELLIEDLRNHKIIAVDLEHHSYRTFMGITCLMQISTVDTDYLVDTLILRDKLHALNEIFTKPSILKIFHGADSDILWLQRDLSLYVVNMFDTHQAAKLLEYSSLSLASLLERFCKFIPNKHYQLADWRMRPLPDVLKEYARSDTHYLIYIYHILKRELLKKVGGSDKLLRIVYERSTDICKQKFFKKKWTEESHLDFYTKCKRMFDNRQMFALKELYKWRDQMARNEDESTGYVLPNHMLLQISENLPREMQGIIACCNPVPPLVKSNLLDIHKIILKAREQSLNKPILQEDTRAKGSTLQFQKLKLDSPLNCPHDLTRTGDFRDDLPVLLGSEKNINSEVDKVFDLETVNSEISIFNQGTNDVRKFPTKKRFLCPYERYQFVKPFIQEEENKIIQIQEKEIREKQLDESIDENIAPCTDEVIDITPIPESIEIEDEIDEINKNLNSLIQEDKTDEERIASIRKHFEMLSKKTREDEDFAKRKEEQLYEKATSIVTQRVQSLVEIGGSKKRKRESVDLEESTVEDSNLEDRFLNPAPYSNKYISPGQKRKRDNDYRDEDDSVSPNQDSKKIKLNKEVESNREGQNNNEIRETETSGVRHNNAKYSNRSSRGKFNRSTPRNQKRKPKTNEDSNFESFDYSSVDFRQFQGGGRSVNQGNNIKHNYKNKGKKKNMNKGFNKSGTFKNSGNKKSLS